MKIEKYKEKFNGLTWLYVLMINDQEQQIFDCCLKTHVK